MREAVGGAGRGQSVSVKSLNLLLNFAMNLKTTLKLSIKLKKLM